MMEEKKQRKIGIWENEYRRLKRVDVRQERAKKLCEELWDLDEKRRRIMRELRQLYR